MSLLTLPLETLLEIVSFLPNSDWWSLILTNRYLHFNLYDDFQQALSDEYYCCKFESSFRNTTALGEFVCKLVENPMIIPYVECLELLQFRDTMEGEIPFAGLTMTEVARRLRRSETVASGLLESLDPVNRAGDYVIAADGHYIAVLLLHMLPDLTELTWSSCALSVLDGIPCHGDESISNPLRLTGYHIIEVFKNLTYLNITNWSPAQGASVDLDQLMILCSAESLLKLEINYVDLKTDSSNSCISQHKAQVPARASKLKILTIISTPIKPCCLLILLRYISTFNLFSVIDAYTSGSTEPSLQLRFARLADDWLKESGKYIVEIPAEEEWKPWPTDSLHITSGIDLEGAIRANIDL